MKVRQVRKWAVIVLAGAFWMCLGIVWALVLSYGRYLPSFPGLLFGQLTLTKETRQIYPVQYQSAEFLLGQVQAWQIERAEYIVLGEEVYFWEPPYPGFSRVTLSPREIRQARDLLTGGEIFQSPSTGSEYLCLMRPGPALHALEPCQDGAAWMEHYARIQSWSNMQRSTGVLVAYLRGGPGNTRQSVVEITIFRTDQGLAYYATEHAGRYWLKGITNSTALIDSLSARAQVEPAELLWPLLSPAAANARAARVLGKGYLPAIEAVRNSARARLAYGDPLTVRPAKAVNVYSSWMDSTSILLTLSVSGPLGEGAALVRGFPPYDDFQVELVHQGMIMREESP